MSVTMVGKFPSEQPEQLPKHMEANADTFQAITASARTFGLLTHYWSYEPGFLVVVDTWPDEQSFRRFFTDNESQIRQAMSPVITGDPEIVFYENLDTQDQVGLR
jgi:hypothetical protein